MSVTVVAPSVPPRRKIYTRLRDNVSFNSPVASRTLAQNFSLKVPYFILDNEACVLLRDLATLWNFPSSYQLLFKLRRGSGLSTADLVLATTADLNDLLVNQGLLGKHEIDTKFFYISLQKLQQILDDEDCLFGEQDSSENVVRKYPISNSSDDEAITVSQVFPNYDQVEESLPLTHATFLSLTPMTKLQIYKHEGHFRKVYGIGLTANERDLITLASNYSQYDASKQIVQQESEDTSQNKKKPLGRHKKHIGTVDPNQLDIAENILPGCGYIPEFNVNAICKAPNYFVTSNQMNTSAQSALINPLTSHMKSLQINMNESSKMSKQLHLLLAGTDQEPYQFKYYYYKSYRGPGSGNYKDAVLVNKINNIRKFTKSTNPTSNAVTHLSANRVSKGCKKRRGDKQIKGLVHEFFSKDNVDIVTERQRKFTEDFCNMEMLHNNALYNLLVNAYRDVSIDTWKCFYKFKTIEFEKLFLFEQAEGRQKRRALLQAQHEAKQNTAGLNVPPLSELIELSKPDITSRFVLPSEHAQIMTRLPIELRGASNDPVTALSKPVRYVATYPDRATPEFLNQIEVVKLPNANAIGWDNIKKYRN